MTFALDKFRDVLKQSFTEQPARSVAEAAERLTGVLGAWNALTRELISVTNTTVVNTETMCELLHKIAAAGLTGPITLVPDNARHQHHQIVKALAESWGITLRFLPGYSPHLNLIERLLKFIQRDTLRGRYYANFTAFRSAIDECLAQFSTKHASSR